MTGCSSSSATTAAGTSALSTRPGPTRWAGHARSPWQIMADTLVERVTGQTTATAVPVQVHLVLPDRVLLGQAEDAAELHGYGPIPRRARGRARRGIGPYPWSSAASSACPRSTRSGRTRWTCTGTAVAVVWPVTRSTRVSAMICQGERAWPAHRVGPGLVESALVPAAVVAEELEHPVMRPVEARREAVEGQNHLENYLSVHHVGRDSDLLVCHERRREPDHVGRVL